MKEHFLDRLYGEYQEYRASLLGCTNTEIFSRCYEIDAIVNSHTSHTKNRHIIGSYATLGI